MPFAWLVALVTLIAGLTPIGARLAATELPPLTLAFARFGSAGLLLAATMRASGRRWAFDKSDRRTLVLLALLCVPLNQIGFLWGVKWANASHAGVAYALTPVLVFWIAWAMGRARFESRLAAATLFAFAGAAAIALSHPSKASDVSFDAPAGLQDAPEPSSSSSKGATPASRSLPQRFLQGDLLLLSAVTTWSLFCVLSQPIVRRRGSLQTLSAVFLLGALFHAPLVGVDYFYLELKTLQWSAVTWKALGGAAFITLMTSYLSYLLWYVLIARHDLTQASVITNSSFLVAVAVEAIFLKEPIGPLLIPGAALTFLGVVLASIRGVKAL